MRGEDKEKEEQPLTPLPVCIRGDVACISSDCREMTCRREERDGERIGVVMRA